MKLRNVFFFLLRIFLSNVLFYNLFDLIATFSCFLRLNFFISTLIARTCFFCLLFFGYHANSSSRQEVLGFSHKKCIYVEYLKLINLSDRT